MKRLSIKTLFLTTYLMFFIIPLGYAYEWNQTSQADFEAGTPANVNTSTSPGDVVLEIESLPQPSASTREERFAPQNSEACGVIAADGTYLYVKSWSSYDGND
ncbi:MAG: hypothetical protein U9Q08_02885, partial [Candidatus Omnitrophota bacterium]|nr:hypothetical protein [Candidatus Omnitrophota bacterium]